MCTSLEVPFLIDTSVPPMSGQKCRHGSEVLVVLTALSLIRGASLRADQCLWRSGAFSHVRHVQAMMVDLLVQMLTALLPCGSAATPDIEKLWRFLASELDRQRWLPLPEGGWRRAE